MRPKSQILGSFSSDGADEICSRLLKALAGNQRVSTGHQIQKKGHLRQ
jgi:hypothetical protein